MKISDLLSQENVVRLASPNKHRLIEALSRHAAERLRLIDAEIGRALAKREKLGSTGVGNGIAFPHTRLDGVHRPFGLFAVLAKPIEFGAVDDRLVDLVFLLLLPADAPEDQLRSLACVARRFKEPGLADALRETIDPSSLYRLLLDREIQSPAMQE